MAASSARQEFESGAVANGPMTALTIRVDVPEPFSLRNAICSYGFYMTAPNRWIEEEDKVESLRADDYYQPGAFTRPLYIPNAKGKVSMEVTGSGSKCAVDGDLMDSHLVNSLSCLPADGIASVMTKLRQQRKMPILDVQVMVENGVALDDLGQRVILAQVRRMLRLSQREEHARETFQRVWCHHHHGPGPQNLMGEFDAEASVQKGVDKDQTNGSENGPARKKRRLICTTCTSGMAPQFGLLFRSPSVWEGK